MNITEIIGFLGASLTTVSFLPQVRKSFKNKSTGDLSIWMLLLFTAGVGLWLVYGLFLGSYPIIIANALTLIFNLTLIVLKIKYH